VRLSNSFTFDLIGMNQAARKGDKEGANQLLQGVRKDLQEFLTLEVVE